MAETYNVYFGPTGSMVLISEGQAGLEVEIPSTLLYNIEYSWRVDAVNEYGTTTGDVWSFTTLLFIPPLPSGITLPGGIGGGMGEPTGDATGMNGMVTLKRLVVVADDSVFYET